MAVLFFDTSALVKRYYRETGTNAVDELIGDERPMVITSLTIVEITSAFRRKYNRDEITRDEMRRLLTACFGEILDSFTVVPIVESMPVIAFDLILEDDLRTLDSLQLAAGLSMTSDETDVVFVSADSSLVTVAGSRGLDVVDPSD